MSVKIVASFSVLMSLAGELGRAKKSGDHEAIKAAQAAHDVYKDICLKADSVSLNVTYGDLL